MFLGLLLKTVDRSSAQFIDLIADSSRFFAVLVIDGCLELLLESAACELARGGHVDLEILFGD